MMKTFPELSTRSVMSNMAELGFFTCVEILISASAGVPCLHLLPIWTDVISSAFAPCAPEACSLSPTPAH